MKKTSKESPVSSIPSRLRAWHQSLWVAKLSPKTRLLIHKVAVGAAVVWLTVVSLGALAIYGLGWDNQFTATASRLTYYPAGMVDWDVVPYNDYILYKRALKLYATKLHETNPATQVLGDKEYSQEAFGYEVNQVLIRRWAHAHKLQVSKDERDKEVARIFHSYGGDEAATKLLKEQYGYSKSDFVRLVERQLLQAKVAVSLASDQALNKEAIDVAKDILARARKGQDFVTLVNGYSQDPASRSKGGLVLVKDLPQSVRVVAGEVAIGQVATTLLADGSDRYIVFRDANDKDGQPQARIIVRKTTTYDVWLAQQYQQSSLSRWLPQLRGR
jgi:hypothetical protein